MRAFAVMTALSRCTNVSTLVIPVAGPTTPLTLAANIRCQDLPSPELAAASWLRYPRGRALLQSAGRLPLRARLAAPACTDALAIEQVFDLVYVLRLYMAGTVLPLMQSQPATRFILDIDEDDAAVMQQQAQLLDESGYHARAEEHRMEALTLQRFSAMVLPWFDTIACASECEAQAVATAHERVVVLPNVIEESGRQAVEPASGAPRLLFLGNLDYLPNQDAVARLVEKILPGIQDEQPGARLCIAGTGGEALREQLGHAPGVDWRGFVENVSALYDWASVVVVPLRAGGGSRVKILEAFARGLPVVATAKALEGLAVTGGCHATLAESDAEIATAVLHLARDVACCNRQVAAARAFVRINHSPEVLAKCMALVIRSPGEAAG